MMNPFSGQFSHCTFERFSSLRSLAELEIEPGECKFRVPCQDRLPLNHAKVLHRADAVYSIASEIIIDDMDGIGAADPTDVNYEPKPSPLLLDFEWWLTSSAAVSLVRGEVAAGKVHNKAALQKLSLTEQIELRQSLQGTSGLSELSKHQPPDQLLKQDSIEEIMDGSMAKIMRPRG